MKTWFKNHLWKIVGVAMMAACILCKLMGWLAGTVITFMNVQVSWALLIGLIGCIILVYNLFGKKKKENTTTESPASAGETQEEEIVPGVLPTATSVARAYALRDRQIKAALILLELRKEVDEQKEGEKKANDLAYKCEQAMRLM